MQTGQCRDICGGTKRPCRRPAQHGTKQKPLANTHINTHTHTPHRSRRAQQARERHQEPFAHRGTSRKSPQEKHKKLKSLRKSWDAVADARRSVSVRRSERRSARGSEAEEQDAEEEEVEEE